MKAKENRYNERMLSIAIVEDEKEASDHFLSLLNRFESEEKISLSTAVFSSPLPFITNYKPVYDIIFMDIEMPQMDGLALAHQLRKVDSLVILIFVTNMSQFAIRGYEVGALSFIVKPLTYPGLKIAMESAISSLSLREKQFQLVPIRGGFRKIEVGEIVFLEVRGHNLTYHLEKDNYVAPRQSMSKIEKDPLFSNFIRCNNCYLVNPDYIKEVKNYSVIVGASELLISHPRRKAFMQAIAAYFGRK